MGRGSADPRIRGLLNKNVGASGVFPRQPAQPGSVPGTVPTRRISLAKD